MYYPLFLSYCPYYSLLSNLHLCGTPFFSVAKGDMLFKIKLGFLFCFLLFVLRAVNVRVWCSFVLFSFEERRGKEDGKERKKEIEKEKDEVMCLLFVMLF